MIDREIPGGDCFGAVLLPDLPHLEEDGLVAFENYVAATPCYLEYGSGGSTLHAVRIGARQVVSVDSSKKWIDAIKQRLSSASNIELIYCDVGPVAAWGRPNNNVGLHAYHAYMAAPWKVVHQQSIRPKVIFIDGRFRVACFLYSLVCADPGAIILFDDYMNRKHYHIVEDFCVKIENHGRMAIFSVSKNYSLPDIVARIAEYSIIPD